MVSSSILWRLAAQAILTLCASALWIPPKEYAIHPSQDGHFLQANGKPFFWQADTSWLLFSRLNYTDAELYLTDRARKGYNIVLAVGFVQGGMDATNRNGDTVFIDADVTRPNEPYWRYVDSIVKLAWEKGIRVAMVPAWGSYIHNNDNVGNVINETTAYGFGDFIGSRYPYLPKTLVADTNSYWTNKTAVKADYAAGGVHAPYKYTDWTPVYDQLALGIVEGERSTIRDEAWQPLMSIHPTNQWFEGGPVGVASAFYDKMGWLTLNTCQSGHTDYPPNPPIPWWNARRGWEPVEMMYAVGETEEGNKRPALDNEPHYENRYNNGKATGSKPSIWNASDVRVGAWQSVFAGAAGVTYGNNNVMQMYNPEFNKQDGSGPESPWYVDINMPGASHMQHIGKAITDRGPVTFYTRVPAQEIITGDPGTNDQRIAACRDIKGSWIMAYTPVGKSISLKREYLRGHELKASWYDPTEGTYIPFNFSESATFRFFPPKSSTHLDWVLVLETARNVSAAIL